MDDNIADYEKFFRANWRRVRALAARRVGEDSAADVASEAMLTAWEKWEDRPKSNEDAALYWVLSIAKYKVLHEWRRRESIGRLEVLLKTGNPVETSEEYSAERVAISKITLVESFHKLSHSDRDIMRGKASRAPLQSKTHPANRRERRASASAMRRSRARRRLLDGLE